MIIAVAAGCSSSAEQVDEVGAGCKVGPNAVCRDQDLQSVSLVAANLRGADFSGSKLNASDFTEADLRGAKFVGSDLSAATFAGANLSGADLSKSNLYYTNFTDADMKGVNRAGIFDCFSVSPDGAIGTCTPAANGAATPSTTKPATTAAPVISYFRLEPPGKCVYDAEGTGIDIQWSATNVDQRGLLDRRHPRQLPDQAPRRDAPAVHLQRQAPHRHDAGVRSGPTGSNRHDHQVARRDPGGSSRRVAPPISWTATPASTLSRRRAASLSRYSFQFPHLGDWTHDGQPPSQGQVVTSSRGGLDVALEPGERELRDPGAARVAVVDEDRRLQRCRVQRHRDAADVPPVADREERQQPDQRVLGRVHRTEHLVRLDPGADQLEVRDRVPAGAESGRVCGGRSSGTISIVAFVDARLRW